MTRSSQAQPYPHVAAGNMEFLGGCGACGTLSHDGKARSYVVTDVTDVKDDLDRQGSSWPPYGSHIDMMGTEFDFFQTLPRNGGQLDFSKGGIFTGNWTRVPCETLGPNYPDGPGGNTLSEPKRGIDSQNRPLYRICMASERSRTSTSRPVTVTSSPVAESTDGVPGTLPVRT